MLSPVITFVSLLLHILFVPVYVIVFVTNKPWMGTITGKNNARGFGNCNVEHLKINFELDVVVSVRTFLPL